MNKKSLAMVAFLLGVASSIGIWFANQQPESSPAVDSSTTKIPLFYRHPMNPSVTSPIPAKDKMGMDYVPVYAGNGTEKSGLPSGQVEIDPVT